MNDLGESVFQIKKRSNKITNLLQGLALGGFISIFVIFGLWVFSLDNYRNKHSYIVQVEYSNGDIDTVKFVSKSKEKNVQLKNSSLFAGDKVIVCYTRNFKIISCTEIK